MLLALLAACGPAPVATGVDDPYEASNRKVHDFNKKLDTAFQRDKPEVANNTAVESADTTMVADAPAVAASPEPVAAPEAARSGVSPLAQGLNNFGRNLDHPRMILNSLLQLRPGDAARNTMRFGINSTLGLGGVFDVARVAGMPERTTDFGETLHVWGVPEGAYLELPVIGPSTQRDAAGKVVDFAINPLWYVLGTPTNAVAVAFTLAPDVVDRVKYADTVDSVLYGSADSYAQSRQIYLQNRRYDLGGGAVGSNDESIDLYEDLYAD
ncbi:VacJ family lipoprotein [Tropicimonas sp. IMCC34043]|uniref:MlaA family lipoprotein n=1 Tax=Tropicimonas sp. IMCC34043 TaxID=2248760 RepID=UPI001E3C5543|nr:VacJ family lipoprotein [Tropicimonas sp. IMCC34043]